jgi:hypothetical protein
LLAKQRAGGKPILYWVHSTVEAALYPAFVSSIATVCDTAEKDLQNTDL